MRFFPADLFFMPALVALIAAALATRALRRGRRAMAPGHPPLCGGCGYDTRGLTTLTCPECGSDLRVVGIGAGVTRRTPRLVSFVACAVFLAFVLYALSGVLTDTLLPMVPARMEYSSQITVTSRADANRSFAISSAGRGGATPVTIEMQLRGGAASGGQSVRLVYDPVRDAGFGPKTVRDWMNAANVTDPAAAKEAARIAGYARKIARHTRGRESLDYAYGGTGGSRSSSGGAGIFAAFAESFSARPSQMWIGTFRVLRWLWAILSVAMLIVLFRAIVLGRAAAAASPAFTPTAGRE